MFTLTNINVFVKCILLSILLKSFVCFFGYSGKGKPPMYGDYEAQRHWMEITYNVPIKEWYFDTVNNNLTHWGLDYPPLTAYHSWIMGAFADKINPDYVKLNTSRGFESIEHKLFMRITVLVCDIFMFTFGLCLYGKTVTAIIKDFKMCREPGNKANLEKFLMVSLLYPGLILIDHGHFQYNCVCLGFTLLSITALIYNYDVISAVLYCLSFSYKQMALYYALPFFFYFLGKCLANLQISFTAAFNKLMKIGLSVILSIGTIWFPFLMDIKVLKQIIHRIFPLYRGIFEDKVANIWCVINVFYKLKKIPNETMALVCTALVIVACAPSCLELLIRPEKEKFVLSLINSSLAFFLFSFQVHEKTILFVALPVILTFCHKPVHCSWFLIISTFSMLPLLIKDDLITPTIVLSLIYGALCFSLLRLSNKRTLYKEFFFLNKFPNLYFLLFMFSLFGCVLLSVISLVFPPPVTYPHLFPLLNSVYSAFHFLYFLFYFNYSLFTFRIKKAHFAKSKKHK